MAGMSFGGLFGQQNQYADDGSLITAGAQDYAGKYSTQVIANNTATGAATATIYTVPAKKLFFLAHCTFTLVNVTLNNPAFYLKKNAAGAFVVLFKFVAGTATPTGTDFVSVPLGMPLRFIAGDTVDIQCDNANCLAVCNIHGWLEDA